jgi:hypothetical protein
MKMIAWGTSKLLYMHLIEKKDHPFVYCIDDFTDNTEIADLPIHRSNALATEEAGNFILVVFAVSNFSLQAIFQKLSQLGLKYKKDFILYSDYFLESFENKFKHGLGWSPDRNIYNYSVSFTLNSRKPIHTTILGTWLFLEVLKKVQGKGGAIAEVGAFEGGNALCALNYAYTQSAKTQEYYIFDSFEGFPELTSNDPSRSKKGDYVTTVSFQEICDSFVMFPNALLIKGFVPDSFAAIPAGTKFSLVFYDCDLYRPAIDTYNFMWDKILPGGYLLIHDYEAEPGGFSGVRKATDVFFGGKGIPIVSFVENTTAIIRKPV